MLQAVIISNLNLVALSSSTGRRHTSQQRAFAKRDSTVFALNWVDGLPGENFDSPGQQAACLSCVTTLWSERLF